MQKNSEIEFTMIKHPRSAEDCTIDYAPYLDADTITASAWESPTGITVSTSGTNTTTTASTTVSTGKVGAEYVIVNHITTAGGVEFYRSVLVKVREI